MPFSDELVCEVNRVEYDFNTKIGALWMQDGQCCDMSGCLKLFKRIDPEVKRIQTYSGEALDTVYTRELSDKWESRLAGGNA